MSHFRRRLPHIYREGKWVFFTWHLAGSLPHRLFPPPGKRSDGKAFVWMDRYLDSCRLGPDHLRKPELAQVVEESISYGVKLGHYELGAWVIMPNHVHLLVRPLVDPGRLLQSLKGATSRRVNLILGRTGQAFWQAESYDHWVRDEAEFARIRAYIEANPVRASLAATASEYRWSSAHAEPALDNEGQVARATTPPRTADSE